VTGSNGSKPTTAERIAVAAYASMEKVAVTLPEKVGRLAFAGLGALAYRVAPGARETVSRNMSKVLGLPPEDPLVVATTREAFGSYARYWYDTFHARTLSREELARRFEMVGDENIRAAEDLGKGCIIALPHLGNWDVAGQYVALSHRLIAVAEDLKPRELAEQFRRHREALGMEILVLTDAKAVGFRLVQLLAENAVVALVADRDLGGKGIDVEMFGATRKIPAGPAMLSITSGAPLLTATIVATQEGWRCTISEPVTAERTGKMRADVTALTRALAAEFERSVASCPVEWHMFQPAWPEQRDVPQQASLLALE
jgi:KDO2-lipid IV(A) lauroyltransferase